MGRISACALSLCLLASAALAGQTAISGFDFARGAWFWPLLYDIGGETVYCGYTFGVGQKHTTPDGFPIAVAHAYPAAWIAQARGCANAIKCSDQLYQYAVADLHNLWPAAWAPYAARGDLPFGEVPKGEKGELVGRCLRRHRDPATGAVIIEPPDAAKGKLARSILYMVETYHLPWHGLEKTMRRWHNENPPDNIEHWRNFVIEQLQGTSNPYIQPWVGPR
jgi:deoxyribonuclease-1